MTTNRKLLKAHQCSTLLHTRRLPGGTRCMPGGGAMFTQGAKCTAAGLIIQKL